jgi:putative tributyrin esterase
MALIRVDHTPETVKKNLPLNIILPDPGQIKGVPIKDRKVLYLLHGLGDDASAWQRYSSIEIYARLYGLVVVMPSAGRSFYIDQPNGQAYLTYLVEELPQYLKDVFGIVPKRDNTLIAGNSMGGYGALKTGLNYPERFFAVASLSGLVSMAVLSLMPDDPRKQEFIHIFGDLNKLPGSEHDPATWLKKAANNPAAIPYLYLSCGKQEDLYTLNVQFNTACRSLGVDVDYYEYDGTHTWPYWDIQIQRFLSKILEPVE